MSTALWTSAEAAHATGGRDHGLPWEASGVSIDTRTLVGGDLFVALRGPRADGHEFVDQAFGKGAVAVVVEREIPSASSQLVVDDSLTALGSLGTRARERTSARVVAVTGSVGKTGTKNLLRAALGGEEGVYASTASYNNDIGVPLSLARLPEESAFAVFEIGMNHPGEIAPLAALVMPDAALVTRIAPAHLEHLGGIDAVVEEKASVFSGFASGGIALIPEDSPGADRLRSAAQEAGAVTVIGFGLTDDVDVRLLNVAVEADQTRASCSLFGEKIDFHLRLLGRHWAMNALAAGACAVALGAAPAEVFRRMSDVGPFAGRGKQFVVPLPDGAAAVIDDSYNANPASVRAALEMLAEAPVRGRRIAVLGDMRELGSCSKSLHADLADALQGIDFIFCVGTEMEALFDALPEKVCCRATDAEAAAKALQGMLAPGDVVLVKGSRAIALETVVHRLARAGGD